MTRELKLAPEVAHDVDRIGFYVIIIESATKLK
jgi:hypothetical protein